MPGPCAPASAATRMPTWPPWNSKRASQLCRPSFFHSHVAAIQKRPDRADARLEAPLRREALLHLDQADVVLRLDQAEQEVAMGIELRASRLALRARGALSGLARPAHPDDRGSDPAPEADRSLPGRHARQRRINHSIPQILTVGPRHAPPPPDPGRRTRMLHINRESPPESERAEHALGRVDGFDEDEAESEGNDGAVVLGRLLTPQRHTLEPLQLT